MKPTREDALLIVRDALSYSHENNTGNLSEAIEANSVVSLMAALESKPMDETDPDTLILGSVLAWHSNHHDATKRERCAVAKIFLRQLRSLGFGIVRVNKTRGAP